MTSNVRPLLRAVAFSWLLLPAAARVIWIPEEFDPLIESSRLTARQDAEYSLRQCGEGFPEDFYCPSNTACLLLQTDPSVTATICCPLGKECQTIGTVSCDQDLQNATLAKNSMLHSEPTVELDTCGEQCCPMGYSCDGGNLCVASTFATPTSSSATESASTSTSTSTGSSNAPAAGAGAGGVVIDDEGDTDPSESFNGKSFAAGLVPGLVIGAIIAACIILLLLRRKRKTSRSGSSWNEKGSRDTLTDLSASPDYRPTMHGRSISEPVVDPRFGNRNDFLRSSPPRASQPASAVLGNSVDIHSDAQQRPVTPGRTPRIKALFSHSPFMVPQTPSTPPTEPVPAHLKRGTLSFKISPVRALKKQKSMHSLRRQMNDASHGRSRSNSRHKLDRSDSQETILVRMNNEPYTPEQAPQMAEKTQTLSSTRYQPHDSTSTWMSESAMSEDDTPDERVQAQNYHPAPLAAASRPVANAQYTTPTRAPTNPSTGALGSPYTPTNQVAKAGNGNGMLGANLRVNPRTVDDTRRDTTFSAMMERAGLRRSDLVPVPPMPKTRK